MKPINAQETSNGILHAWRNLRLGNKLAALLLAVTLIPLVIFTYLDARENRKTLAAEGNAKLAGAAKQTAAVLDTFIAENVNAVRVEAQSAVIVDYVSLPEEQRADSAEESRLLQYLASASREDPVFLDSISILNAEGITLADTSPRQIGADQSTRAYFQQALINNRAYASSVEYDPLTAQAALYFAAPVRGANGEVIGVIGKRFNAAVLMEYVQAGRGLAGAGSFPVLLDENRAIIAHGANAALINTAAAALTPELETGLNNAPTQPYFAADISGDNLPEQIAAQPLTTQRWTVIFAIPQADFLAPLRAQTQKNILLAAGIAALVGALGLIVSRAVSAPIVRLTQTAESIAEGNLNAQAPVESGDEIGILAETFNRTTQQARAYAASMERQMEARNKEMATVAEIGTATLTIADTSKLLKVVVDLTKERFDLYHAQVCLLDADGENLVTVAAAGETGRVMVEAKQSIALERQPSLIARSARERQTLLANDVTQCADFLPNPLLPYTRAKLVIPMLAGDALLGIFDVQAEDVNHFSDLDVNVFSALATQLAAAIQNARLRERAEKSADRETLLTRDPARKAASPIHAEDPLEAVANKLVQALENMRAQARRAAQPVKKQAAPSPPASEVPYALEAEPDGVSAESAATFNERADG